MPFPKNVRIVLVEPEHPGNLGSVARAMKTMGLSDLVLVRPQCDPSSDEAIRMAHHAEEVLAQVRTVNRLEEALADICFSVATSQRTRRQGVPFLSPEEAVLQIHGRAAEHPAALVFGRESSGLTNHELALCSALSTIPAATRLPALNLAQAVMVYAYVLFQASLKPAERSYRWRVATQGEVEQFYRHLEETLVALGARPATTLAAYVDKFRRVFNRVPLEPRDVNLLHKLLLEMDGFVERARDRQS